MSLTFITGGAGSGKSTWLFRRISREAAENPNKKYLILVPDQFTLETQKTMVELGGGGILNVDVLSFHRLAYRAFEEVPALRRTVLEDMGKMMLLRKVFAEQKKNLKYFKRGVYRPGFLDECKSLLSEFLQYDISAEDLESFAEEESLMSYKLQDLQLIYRAFQEKMGDSYMTAEELIPQLTNVVSSLPSLRDCVIALDGFTGFTPTQYELLESLLGICEKMYVTVTTDRTGRRDRVFSLSRDTIRKMSQLAKKCGVEPPVVMGYGEEKVPYRLRGNPELVFLEENIFSYRSEKWEARPSSVEIRACRRPAGEAAYVAREIHALVSSGAYRFDEIAVVTSDMAAYEQALSRELERFSIRYFLDYKKSFGANAMAEYILSFLEMVRMGMDYESTFRFLRCGLSPLEMEETDVLENYVIARGRRGLRSYQSQWEYAVEGMDLVDVNRYRQKFAESVAESVRDMSGGKKTVEEYTRLLYRLLTKNDIFQRLMEKSRRFEEEGEIILSREYKRIYRLMIELFDELVELLGPETVSFREYEELLAAGISQGLVGIVPPTSNQVMVGDVERSRLKDIRVLFFLGVNDDRIPKGQDTPGLLSEQERKRMKETGVELAPDGEQRAWDEQFYLYLTLAKASDRLVLTYSQVGADGGGKRPAYLIRKLRNLFPRLEICEDEKDDSAERVLGSDRGRSYLVSRLADESFREDMRWWELAACTRREDEGYWRRLVALREGRRMRTGLSAAAAERLYGPRLYGSVTRLEQFARCPYAHFLLFGLRLREREQYHVDLLDYGNVFHSAMEHFSHCMEKESWQWQDMTGERIESLSDICIDFAVEHYRGELFFQSGRTAFTVKRMKHVMRKVVWGIWQQMKKGDFVQKYAEKEFSGGDGLESLRVPLADGKDMVLTGKIDRVDVCDAGDRRLIKIVDYKSGENTLDLSKVYHGLQLQLLTYMAAAMEVERDSDPPGNVVPAAMLYYQMREPELDWMRAESPESLEERALAALHCAGYVNGEGEILSRLDSDVAADGEVIPGSTSRILPVSVKKDGTYSARSRVMGTEDFGRLIGHVRKKLEEFGDRIYQGEIDRAPCHIGGECGCDYCRWQSVCGMEKRELAKSVREYPVMSEEEVWEVLYGLDR